MSAAAKAFRKLPISMMAELDDAGVGPEGVNAWPFLIVAVSARIGYAANLSMPYHYDELGWEEQWKAGLRQLAERGLIVYQVRGRHVLVVNTFREYSWGNTPNWLARAAEEARLVQPAPLRVALAAQLLQCDVASLPETRPDNRGKTTGRVAAHQRMQELWAALVPGGNLPVAEELTGVPADLDPEVWKQLAGCVDRDRVVEHFEPLQWAGLGLASRQIATAFGATT